MLVVYCKLFLARCLNEFTWSFHNNEPYQKGHFVVLLFSFSYKLSKKYFWNLVRAFLLSIKNHEKKSRGFKSTFNFGFTYMVEILGDLYQYLRSIFIWVQNVVPYMLTLMISELHEDCKSLQGFFFRKKQQKLSSTWKK